MWWQLTFALVSQDKVRFVALDKCHRCWLIASSWCGIEFQDLAKRRNEGDPKIKEGWDEAEEALDLLDAGGEESKNIFPNPTSVRVLKRSGMRTEAVYWFLTIKQYRIRFKFDPKLLKEIIVTVDCEENLKQLHGILFRPTPGDNMEIYRKIILFSEKVWLIDENMIPQHRHPSVCITHTPQFPAPCFISLMSYV
jgi:hypothetical protein